MRKIGETESLCPECLRTVAAEKVAVGDEVYLVKSCPDHGEFRTLIWRGVKDYLDLGRYARPLEALPDDEGRTMVNLRIISGLTGVPRRPHRLAVKESGDCPQICGLCPDHEHHTGLAVLEVTNGCNLNCPICFARSNEGYRYHPDLGEIDGMWRTIVENVEHPICVQVSGGEPTIRDDLPEIVRRGKAMGVDYVEVNTNGVRVAADVAYLAALRVAGVDSLFFSFDGLTQDVYEKTCGRDLLEVKKKALDNCAEVGMPVLLVAVVSPRINLDQVGDIIRFASERIPTVKGVHFQPISFFGRYPEPPKDEDRMLIPDLLKEIERQTRGEIREENFIPTSSADVHCDAKCLCVQGEDGRLLPITRRLPYRNDRPGGKTVREETEGLWSFLEKAVSDSPDQGESVSTGFLKRVRTRYLIISMMAFQDVWNVETERLKRCCIHTVTPDGRLIPFCLLNINSRGGRTLYRREVFGDRRR